MKLSIASIALMATSASAGVINYWNDGPRSSPVFVTLTRLSGTKVRAAVTNRDHAEYNLFVRGTFLDEVPINKFHVRSKSSNARFAGIVQRISYDAPSPDSFRAIHAGETLAIEVELAELYDMDVDGPYDISTAGRIYYAEANSTELTGKALTFNSNRLSFKVDSFQAKMHSKAVDKIAKRTIRQSDCTGNNLAAINTALDNCQKLATSASDAASSGDASKFEEYFMTTDEASRKTVAERFTAVAADCKTTASGPTRTYCTDVYNGCASNVLAYTLPAYNYIAYCPLFFDNLPALTDRCHSQDQATTVLHEETHAPDVYAPGTLDNAYGYNAAMDLSSKDAINNADTYALYANGMSSKQVHSNIWNGFTNSLLCSHLLQLLIDSHHDTRYTCVCFL
jgi:deuterolysin